MTYLKQVETRRFRRILGACAAASIVLGGAFGVAFANDPAGETALRMPFAATVTNSSGDLVDGNVDVRVSVFSDASQSATLLHEELFLNQVIDDGQLVLIIGTGQPGTGSFALDVDTFSAYPEASVELEIGGETLQPRLRLGAAPIAEVAIGMPISGIDYTSQPGSIPVQAIETPVLVRRDTYFPGQAIDVPDPADGWECSHSSRLIAQSDAYMRSFDLGFCRRREIWWPEVGPRAAPFSAGVGGSGMLSVPDGTVTSPQDDVVYLQRTLQTGRQETAAGGCLVVAPTQTEENVETGTDCPLPGGNNCVDQNVDPTAPGGPLVNGDPASVNAAGFPIEVTTYCTRFQDGN